MDWALEMWPLYAFFINNWRKAAIVLTSMNTFLNSHTFIERISFILLFPTK